eukprot:748066-Hanusia_phi.AAC.1
MVSEAICQERPRDSGLTRLRAPGLLDCHCRTFQADRPTVQSGVGWLSGSGCAGYGATVRSFKYPVVFDSIAGTGCQTSEGDVGWVVERGNLLVGGYGRDGGGGRSKCKDIGRFQNLREKLEREAK